METLVRGESMFSKLRGFQNFMTHSSNSNGLENANFRNPKKFDLVLHITLYEENDKFAYKTTEIPR